MHLERTTAPATEFISVAEAAKHVFGDATYNADELGFWITAAIEKAEQWCERAFINQTWKLTLSEFPVASAINPRAAIYLPRGKFQSLVDSQITYVDTNGDSQTLTENTEFTVTSTGDYGRIQLKSGYSWPSVSSYTDEAVIISYVVGYGSSLPDDKDSIKSACLLLIGDLYEIRQNKGTFTIEDSEFYKDFLSPYKIYKDFSLYNEN